jgi:hypothetical protein
MMTTLAARWLFTAATHLSGTFFVRRQHFIFRGRHNSDRQIHQPPCASPVAEEGTMAKKEHKEHHESAAEHHESAAEHHREAAKHYEAGHHEKAAHHAHLAHGHGVHATHHAQEAAKHHVEHHDDDK